MAEQESVSLVIASKVKAYVARKGEGMRTAGDVAEQLTDIITDALDGAIENAKADKRLTLKARDFNQGEDA